MDEYNDLRIYIYIYIYVFFFTDLFFFELSRKAPGETIPMYTYSSYQKIYKSHYCYRLKHTCALAQQLLFWCQKRTVNHTKQHHTTKNIRLCFLCLVRSTSSWNTQIWFFTQGLNLIFDFLILLNKGSHGTKRTRV